MADARVFGQTTHISMKLEIFVNSAWIEVSSQIFRSWTGLRRVNGDGYHGPVHRLGTDDT